MQKIKSQIFKIISVLKASEKSILSVLRIIFILLCIYAIVFSLGLTWVGYKTYSYATSFTKKVEKLSTQNPVQTQFMADYLLENPEYKKLKQSFIPLDSISPHLVRAVLAAEDDGFYQHPGFDLSAILAAFEENKRRGKIKFGGSTITQQLAKNLFLSAEKSFERKGKEMVYSILMEKYLGKDRILELYLNYAQWGKDIFGCQEAAKLYYAKDCSNLNFEQALRLASVLASPEKYTPHHHNSVFLSKRRQVILESLRLQKRIDDSLYQDLSSDSIPIAKPDSLVPDSLEPDSLEPDSLESLVTDITLDSNAQKE
jgi:monofunctional biosynthetic peptidoglycan transglycosylase